MGAVFNFTGWVQERRHEPRGRNQQKSEERFNLLYENTPLIYISLDEYGKIREVNRGFCDFIGYAEEDLISKQMRDLNIAQKEIEEKKKKIKETYEKVDKEIKRVTYQVTKGDNNTPLVADCHHQIPPNTVFLPPQFRQTIQIPLSPLNYIPAPQRDPQSQRKNQFRSSR